ncbi:DUF1697 domain-containing protein [Sporolactobacillus putidus]|uniref:DUF1697 domain-containing protein n=1 Tax=Sporolactobacillus putidus TaxID=492735 RepID=A0A917W3Q3_9BACL|nr:DUF1697 domain-containing protein [Sporolactobacillus putidus]GGL60605.1 hypothetical protein GCM10007968_25770 [Sporolactobacillus putidus]
MTVYLALLRGINVGGKNKIKMADLRHVLESIGLNRVETYIQSGNVLFESDDEEDTLRKKIENEIETIFGFPVVVVLRTAAELERVIRVCPFSEEEIKEAEWANSEGESLYVALLTHPPLKQKMDDLNRFKSGEDDCRIVNRDIYLLLRHSIRHSKLANHLQKLDVPATIRNWKTMNRLHTLAKSRTDKE